MNKRLFKVLTLSALIALSTSVLTSCDDDDKEDNVTPDTPENPQNQENPEEQKDPEENHEPLVAEETMFILNEGKMSDNNSTLDIFRPEATDKKFSGDVYAAANGEIIGDTGQDLIRSGNRLYLSVNGSKYLAKIDIATLKVVEKYEFSAEEGEPRQLVADGGYIYVSLYSGQVARFDTTSITNPQYVTVGSNPEGMAVKDGQLLVCNSGWGSDNRLSVIDLNTFTLNRNIELFNNLQTVTAIKDSVYVTYYDASYTLRTLVVNLTNDKFFPTKNATKMSEYNGLLYCANSESVYDEVGNKTTATNFFSKDVTTGNAVNNSLIEEKYAQQFAEATVYFFEIDPSNGDIYIGLSDYVTNGEIYRFKNDGTFIEKFTTSSINPNHAVFVK